MPRYVLLQHHTPPDYVRGDHWDLLLECDGVLLAWALFAPPAFGVQIPAERLPDHRLFYLDYEGPVSNNRGTVTRCDAGNVHDLACGEDHTQATLTDGAMAGRLTIKRDGNLCQVSFLRSN